MKLTIDTDEELNAEQLYGLYVAAKETKDATWKETKAYVKGFNAGYAKCERGFGGDSPSMVFERGKEVGYKEGYENAKEEYKSVIDVESYNHGYFNCRKDIGSKVAEFLKGL